MGWPYPAGAPVQPTLPLSASFTLISVDLHVRIADFGLARECVAPRPHAARFRDADTGAAGAIKSTWTRLKVGSLYTLATLFEVFGSPPVAARS